mgnify:CR=1 FL=1
MKVESFFEDGFSWSKIAEEPKCGMDKLVESLREEKCCSICESSEDGCGANDLSEAEYWEMKADIYNGL